VKKVLIAEDQLRICTEKDSFLGRADIMVFTAATNEELLKIHSDEQADLIITQLDLPGIKSEDLFNSIRTSKDLREVSTIIICKDTLVHRERCKLCNPNVVFTTPVDVALLHVKIQQFLNVAPRKSYRAVLAVAIEGRFKNRPQPFWTENISTSGMLIKTAEPLTKGSGTFFSFFLPDGTHVSGYGEIARVVQVSAEPEAFLYGVKFTDVDPMVKSAIEGVVK